MEEIYTEHQRLVTESHDSFRRSYSACIDWEERLSIILGARGVGKTTMILQHIYDTFQNSQKALYVSMDDLTVADYRLIDIARNHIEAGGTHLFVDEIHKYANWSQELKNIYDKYKSLIVVASGSSILEVLKGSADLSRRALVYQMEGFSYREFVNKEAGTSFATLTLKEILTNHIEIAHEVRKQIRPLQYLKEYHEYGYYPFYLEGIKNFHRRLNQAVNQILEVDMPLLLGTEVGNIGKIKKLIYLLTVQVPQTPNITKLAERMEIDRKTLTYYLHHLEQASIFRLLWAKGKSHSIFQKPDKILLNNSNLFYLTRKDVNIGTLRESFFVTQTGRDHEISVAKEGDFWIDEEYLVEVGGRDKSFSQIAEKQNSYVVADGLEIGVFNKVPMWMFGFLG